MNTLLALAVGAGGGSSAQCAATRSAPVIEQTHECSNDEFGARWLPDEGRIGIAPSNLLCRIAVWRTRARPGVADAGIPMRHFLCLAGDRPPLAIAGIPTLLSVKGVQIVGVLPGELQSLFVNTAGVSAAAKQPDAAKALIKYLATPEAAAVIRTKGMEPLGR